jgi:hypothetical protein
MLLLVAVFLELPQLLHGLYYERIVLPFYEVNVFPK